MTSVNEATIAAWHELGGSVLDVVIVWEYITPGPAAVYNVTCGNEVVNPIIHNSHAPRKSYPEIHVHCGGRRSTTNIVPRPTSAVRDLLDLVLWPSKLIHSVAGGGRPITRWRINMNRTRTCPLERSHRVSRCHFVAEVDSASKFAGCDRY
ncbi:hypothetical protein EDC04DRAFT_2218230 [Pisolithus marmoratus]|nr:hypothetical protein EDC04DRAFT_2218230 [Pisolithus marmoratus]